MTNSYSSYFRDRGISRKIKLINLRGGKCQMCGYSKNLAALEFHHTDDGSKTFQLSIQGLQRYSLKSILLELEKCLLLCANCHRETHNPSLNGWQNLPINPIHTTEKVPKAESLCEKCNHPVFVGAKLCNTCRGLSQRKLCVSKDILESLVWTKPISTLAKELGISDAAIHKRCKKLNVKKPPMGYWSERRATIPQPTD